MNISTSSENLTYRSFSLFQVHSKFILLLGFQVYIMSRRMPEGSRAKDWVARSRKPRFSKTTAEAAPWVPRRLRKLLVGTWSRKIAVISRSDDILVHCTYLVSLVYFFQNKQQQKGSVAYFDSNMKERIRNVRWTTHAQSCGGEVNFQRAQTGEGRRYFVCEERKPGSRLRQTIWDNLRVNVGLTIYGHSECWIRGNPRSYQEWSDDQVRFELYACH